MTLKYTFMFYHRSSALIIFSLGRRNPLYAEIISWFSKDIYLYVLIRTEKHHETIVTYIKLRLLTLLLKNFFLPWQACRDGLIDIVRALQQRGVPTINTLDKDGLAPIHYAARYDHEEIVQLLIEGGAGNISSGYCFIFSAIVFPRKVLFLCGKSSPITLDDKGLLFSVVIKFRFMIGKLIQLIHYTIPNYK